jgi:CheY-like chemotaxis protein
MSGTKFVLVVEDDDEIRNIIVSSLKHESKDVGLVVIEAKNGHEAIQYAGRQEFHCVVTDLNMPRTSGQELIRSLLGDALNANTPTVVVSAGIDTDFLAAFQGVRTMSKPFDPVELSQTVLREIKLGRMDERVPIHLLNPFVDSMRAIFLEDMHLNFSDLTVLSPTVRRLGDRVDGAMFTSVTLTTGMMQAKIGFSFDKELLSQMKNIYFAPRRAQWAAMNLELIARHTTQALIEKTSDSLMAIFGAAPRVAEITVCDLSDVAKATELAKAPGVTIALATDQGRVFISALAPVKAKRGQA